MHTAFGQTGRAVDRWQGAEPGRFHLYAGDVPLAEARPFLAYFVRATGPLHEVSIRFSADGRQWAEWMELHRDGHNDALFITELMFAETGMQRYELSVQAAGTAAAEVEVHFFSPGATRAAVDGDTYDERPVESRTCPCPLPGFLSRNDWCPSGNCPLDPTPVSTSVTHLIVHHSAGSNSANDWAAVVRSIWDYHVNGNGWDDIGYNWLVDPNGDIYQGRGNNMLGAHFCGHNSNTMGVCVLGDFTNTTPTASALEALETLLAWKSCDRNIDPTGTSFHGGSDMTLPNIAGHRDGCSTSCPGDDFYPLLPTVRLAVEGLIENNCELPTGVSDPSSAFRATALPNPGGDILRLQLSGEQRGPLEVLVLDLHQRPLLRQTFDKGTPEAAFELNTGHLPAGAYLIQFRLKDNTGWLRWVKGE
jgi:hypothetical protein